MVFKEAFLKLPLELKSARPCVACDTIVWLWYRYWRCSSRWCSITTLYRMIWRFRWQIYVHWKCKKWTKRQRDRKISIYVVGDQNRDKLLYLVLEHPPVWVGWRPLFFRVPLNRPQKYNRYMFNHVLHLLKFMAFVLVQYVRVCH